MIIRLAIPFIYLPRTRPPQPILSSPFPFLSTVKTFPEEWFQITSTIAPKPNSDVEPIDCHVSERATPPWVMGTCLICRSCLSQLSKRLPCPIRFPFICSLLRRPSRSRPSCIQPYRPTRSSSVQRRSPPRPPPRQRSGCTCCVRSQSPSGANCRRVDSQSAKVTCALFHLGSRRRPCYALDPWTMDMDSARSRWRWPFSVCCFVQLRVLLLVPDRALLDERLREDDDDPAAAIPGAEPRAWLHR